MLAETPLVLMLAGLVAYTVLGGADFGAGFWQLFGGRGERDRAIREHAHHAMGPVWEVNHVWLIFVLVVCWTAYPTAFGSIMSTLAVPFFVAAVGIILRGTAYAVRSGTATAREQRRVEVVTALSSILTPLALGAVVGAIASGRVPVGNAEGAFGTSWANATSALVGIVAVAAAAYLAAVFLAADAARMGEPELVEAFRRRALGAGVVAGVVAAAGLVVVREDAELVWDGLTSAEGGVVVAISALAGAATLWLVRRGRFGAARVGAAVAVAAVVAGWAVAQRPTFLPGLTVEEAAADRSVLVALLVTVAVGALVLVPALALLFGLVLRGRFDTAQRPIAAAEQVSGAGLSPALARFAVAAGVVGAGVTLVLETWWGTAFGITAMLAAVATGFVALATAAVEGTPGDADETEAAPLPTP